MRQKVVTEGDPRCAALLYSTVRVENQVPNETIATTMHIKGAPQDLRSAFERRVSSCTFLRYPPRKLGKHVSRLLGKYFPGSAPCIAWRELSGVKSRTRGRARWLSRFSRLLSIKLHYSGTAQRGSSGEEKHWGKIIELWTDGVVSPTGVRGVRQPGALFASLERERSFPA